MWFMEMSDISLVPDIMRDERFGAHISTLREASANESGHGPVSYMTESDVPVVNFDKVMADYAGKFHADTPASNDALLQAGDVFYFIEFKDGNMKSEIHAVRRKIFESLLVLGDMLGRTISFSREHMVYVLVYNLEKSEGYIRSAMKRDDYRPSPSHLKIMDCLGNLAKRRPDVFGLRRQFKGLYFNEVYSCSKDDFNEHFIAKHFSSCK